VWFDAPPMTAENANSKSLQSDVISFLRDTIEVRRGAEEQLINIEEAARTLRTTSEAQRKEMETLLDRIQAAGLVLGSSDDQIDPNADVPDDVSIFIGHADSFQDYYRQLTHPKRNETMRRLDQLRIEKEIFPCGGMWPSEGTSRYEYYECVGGLMDITGNCLEEYREGENPNATPVPVDRAKQYVELLTEAIRLKSILDEEGEEEVEDDEEEY
jgi:hypothetical protein